MEVGVGALTVVQVTRDGMPGLLRPGDAGYDPAIYTGGYPALPPVVYGEFATLVLVAAGGVAPYRAEVFDDPGIADGPLPTGTVIPPSSTSITGSALQVGPGGQPFLCSVKVRDAVGAETVFTFWWLVRTPPIVVATPSLTDGICGVPYSETLFIVDGVPPFAHESGAGGAGGGEHVQPQPGCRTCRGTWCTTRRGDPTVPDPGNLLMVDASLLPRRRMTPAAGSYDYTRAPWFRRRACGWTRRPGCWAGRRGGPGRSGCTTTCRACWCRRTTGSSSGRPSRRTSRRAGRWLQDPAYTVTKSFSATKPYAVIAEAEKGRTYNPDGGSPGLQLLAAGGVPKDGWTVDAPHVSQSVYDPGDGASQERVGGYDWTVEYDPDGDGGNNPIAGMQLERLARGVVGAGSDARS